MICMFGMDGTGKTSCARALQRELSSRGYNCQYSRYGFRVLNLFKFAVRRKNDKAGPRPFRQSSARTFLAASVIPVCFLEAVVDKVSNVGRPDETIVISDRYLFDHVVNWLFGWPKFITKLYLRIVDSPDITILLDVKPEVAHWRRPEESLEYYGTMRQKYLKVMNEIHSPKIAISSEGDETKTVDLIMRIFDQLALN